MSELQAFLGDQAIPELFNRLYGDAERLSGDIERLHRFVKLTMAESSSATASNPVAKEQDLDSWLQEDEWQKADSLSAFVDGSSTDTSLVSNSVPEPSTPAPVEMESIARQRLEEEADAAARGMVLTFELMTKQKQSTATSLACALHVMRDASAGFECPQTMVAILRALYGMDAAAREAQNNG